MSRANRPRTFNYRDVFVQGTRGALRLPWDAEHGVAFLEGGTSLLPGNGQIGFDREVAAWVEAIRGHASPAVSGVDARLAVAMAAAGEASLRSGQVVEVEAAQCQLKTDGWACCWSASRALAVRPTSAACTCRSWAITPHCGWWPSPTRQRRPTSSTR